MKTVSVQSEDQSFVQILAERVFSAYDGRTYHWDLIDTDTIWKIHFGVSAGVVGFSDQSRRACVKLFYDNRLKARIRNALKRSKAGLAYRKGLALMEHGIPCPAILGYAENQQGMGLVVSALAEGFFQVDTWINENGPQPSLMVALGAFIRKTHDAGVTHNDLSPRNILIKPGSEGGHAFSFLVLDYEDTQIESSVGQKKRMDNLHHFYERIYRNVEEEGRRFFIEGYAGAEETESCMQTMETLIRQRPSKYTIGT